MKTVYRIPLKERFVVLGQNVIKARRLYVVVDGIGLAVEYDNDAQLTPKGLRGHLIGERDTHALVEASSPEEAITQFLTEWHGAIPGKQLTPEPQRSPALWINPAQPIHEYPSCSLLHKSRKREEFICGEEEGTNGNGEFGMCILAGFDGPDFYCPIEDFNSREYEAGLARTRKTVTVQGYQVVLAESLMPFATRLRAGAPVPEESR